MRAAPSRAVISNSSLAGSLRTTRKPDYFPVAAPWLDLARWRRAPADAMAAPAAVLASDWYAEMVGEPLEPLGRALAEAYPARRCSPSRGACRRSVAC